MNIRPLQVLLCLLLFSEPVLTAQRDTTFSLNSREVTIRFPAGRQTGLILMLPGWNFSKDKTCGQSAFCKKALKKGYVLVCPEMGKSLYASKTFPNTRKEWAAFPQLRFVTDTLKDCLQKKFGLLKPGGRNFVYGISTGSRGGALILENTDSLFRAGALLSGDYDQSLDLKDNLMNGFYGSYKQFPERWEGADNPARNASKIKAALFLGHGKTDAVVPVRQSETFATVLQIHGRKVQTSFKDNQGHAYTYWDSETDAVLAFFDSF